MLRFQVIQFSYLRDAKIFVLDKTSHEELFRKNGVTKEGAEKFKYSFLQKVAISGCIKKATLVIERMTNARKAHLMNLRSCKFFDRYIC